MCTCVHISVTKWCIVEYLSNALWDFCRVRPSEFDYLGSLWPMHVFLYVVFIQGWCILLYDVFINFYTSMFYVSWVSLTSHHINKNWICFPSHFFVVFVPFTFGTYTVLYIYKIAKCTRIRFYSVTHKSGGTCFWIWIMGHFFFWSEVTGRNSRRFPLKGHW